MIKRNVDSFITTITFNEKDFISDDVKRFYGIPREYRNLSIENPYENEPEIMDVEGFYSPYQNELKEIMRIAQLLYWRVIADDAEYRQNTEEPKNGGS